jgi:hypothetical protein
MLLPPAWRKVGMGAMRAVCWQALHPHPGPPPSQGKDSTPIRQGWSAVRVLYSKAICACKNGNVAAHGGQMACKD